MHPGCAFIALGTIHNIIDKTLMPHAPSYEDPPNVFPAWATIHTPMTWQSAFQAHLQDLRFFLKTFAENFHHVSIAFVGTELCQGYHIHLPNYNYTLFVRIVLKVSNSHLTNNMTINNFWVKNVPHDSMACVNNQQICQQNNINNPSYYVKFYHF